MSSEAQGTDEDKTFAYPWNREFARAVVLMPGRLVAMVFLLWAPGLAISTKAASSPGPEITYTNINDPRGPWSIHVVKFPHGRSPFDFRSVHATRRAIGLAGLSDQVRIAAAPGFQPVAAINGDFYQRDGSYIGDPRGLQIVDGELFSAPVGNGSFWIDAAGEPHADNTSPGFAVTWPDGSSSPFGLNGDREFDEIQLYTPAIGRSTRTQRGRDITLEQEGAGPWLPLRPGRVFKARVRSVRDGSNSEVGTNTLVLSLGPSVARELPRVGPGAVLTLSLNTTPNLQGATVAISGGPILLREGKAQRIRSESWRGFESSSYSRRHPRSAIAWNSDTFFLVEVDGRQRRSAGMTLRELADFLLKLGCTEGMNLDGGGSATLWFDGRVRNRPCEGDEREIANSLVIVRKATDSVKAAGKP